MPLNLQEFRFYYPEYDHLTDAEVAENLYNHYQKKQPDLDRGEFHRLIGLDAEPPSAPIPEPAPGQQSGQLESPPPPGQVTDFLTLEDPTQQVVSHETAPQLKSTHMPDFGLKPSHTPYLDKFRDPEKSLRVDPSLMSLEDPTVKPGKIDIVKYTGTPADFMRSTKKLGSLTAESFNRATAGMMARFDKMATKVSEITGLEKGGLFGAMRDQYLANAEKWNQRAGEYGSVDEIVGEIAGGAVPGMIEFVMGPLYAGLTGYAEEGTAKGAIKATAERYFLGKILHAVNTLKALPRTVIGGLVGGTEAAATGGDPKEIAKGAASLGLFSALATQGEKISVGEAIKDFKGKPSPKKLKKDYERILDAAFAAGAEGEKLGGIKKSIANELNEKQIAEVIETYKAGAELRDMMKPEEIEQITPMKEAPQAPQGERASSKPTVSEKPEKPAEEPLRQKAPSQAGQYASAGDFNTAAREAAKDYRKAPPKEHADAADYVNRVPFVMQMPEVVRIARNLMAGKYPKVAEHISRNPDVRGYFKPGGKGAIALKASIMKDPKQALATLAHELGHLVDYLPDKTLKRGKLLGRIASLKRYTRNFLPNKPGAPGELTDADRVRLQKIAKETAGGDKLIDEMIKKELPITPDQIRSIWTSATNEIKTENPDLYKYIAGLSSAEKKSIVKEALKGQVPAQLRRFAKSQMVPTGKKIKVKASAADIQRKYNELIKQEIKKRKLWNEQELRKELKNWTHFWKPFDANENAKYTKYRYSGVELYADFISGVMLAPGTVKRYAPKAYEAYFNYLERKPEMLELYNKVQDQIKSGEVSKQRTKDIREMFRRGDLKWYMQYEKDLKFGDIFKRDFIDLNHFIIKKVKQVGEKNVPAGENPRYKIEEMKYSGSENEKYVRDVFRNVVKPLEKAGADWEEFGEYLFLLRVANERGEMFNPLGHTKETAEPRIKELEQGSTGKALKAAQKELRTIHEEIIDKAEKAGIWSDELIKLMRERKHYARFMVTDYLEKKHGRGPGAKVFKQVGTLNEITHPGTATIMQDLAVIKATNRGVAAKTTVDFLRKHFADEVREADKRWVNKRNEYIEPKDRDTGMIQYLDKGKMKAFYVNKYIAESFESNPIEAMATAKILQAVAKPFRMAFTELNYGFWLFNIHRDYFRAAKNLQGTSAVKFLPAYLKGIKPAFKSVFGVPDAVADQMLKDNMLISVADIRGMVKEDRQIERLLKQYHMTPRSFQSKIVKPFGKMFTYFSNVGRAFERTPKAAGYLYLREKFPDMAKEELGHIVRTQVGSPDFLRAGRNYPIYNNLLLFSNAAKEGYRGDYEALSRSPAEYMWKTAKYHWIPKILQWGAATGALGVGIQKIMDGVSEYDKTNYIIIPLGLTENDRSVYWRIPVDETGRLMGGILWKALNAENMEFKDATTGLFDYMAGQAPTVNPGLDVIADVISYAGGRNPYDNFRGRYAIPESVMEAGGKRAHLEMLKYLSNKMGSGIIYRFKYSKIDKIKTELEEALGLPIASNILGRFLKVSDYGVREDIRYARSEAKSQRMKDVLNAGDVLTKMINQEPLTEADQKALLKLPDILTDNNTLIGLARRHGYLYLEEYMAAGSEEEQAAVLETMIKKHQEVTNAKR